MAKSDDDEHNDKHEPILMMSNDSLAAGDDHTDFLAKCSLSQVFSEQVGQWPMQTYICHVCSPWQNRGLHDAISYPNMPRSSPK